MNDSANRIFLSYRRDDAAGYAGRLEEALEKRLGAGSVFRDVLDIPPGEDFIAAIRARVSGARAVLVLIGPRWAGSDTAGRRRIDDEGDFVRLEVAMALDSGARVIPVLLPGVAMPAEVALPLPLKRLARRNALSLDDANWESDVARLANAIGMPRRRKAWPWALGAVAVAAIAAVAAGVIASLGWLKPVAPADISARLLGSWQGEVRYAWGDKYAERFEFKRHAGELTGTATFLSHANAIESVAFDGINLRFETRTRQSMGAETREITHHYSAELRGQPPEERLALRLHTSGSFDSNPPLEFEARRVDAAASVPAAASAPRP